MIRAAYPSKPDAQAKDGSVTPFACASGFKTGRFYFRPAALLLLAVLFTQALASQTVAAEPARTPPALVEPPISDTDYGHWAFRPLFRAELPEVQRRAWCLSPVDRLVLAAQERRELGPLPPADKTTLLRRVTFDLIGLPPTPGDVDEFLADAAPDAYERALDRLLAAPAFGERQSQHWLDLARFADTDGFEHDLVRPNAWRYRDWVIDALNADLPYDEFSRQQLAGDLLHPDDPAAAIPTGFLLCGPDMPDINLQDERRHAVLNEMTATVGAVFLGLQFGCAACHDHKFDPISQADFYRLRAFFNGVDIFRDHPVPSPQQLAERQRDEAARGPTVRRLETTLRELEDAARQRLREKNPDLQPKPADLQTEMSADERQRHAAATAELAMFKKLPDLPQGRVVKNGAPRESFLMLRGDFRQPGPAVRAAFPRIANRAGRDPAQFDGLATGDRAALARWISQPDQPLFLRVIANRLWQEHFGRGLSASASDFGTLGEAPTHPELLDWLSLELPRQDFSVKRLRRLLTTSAVYRQASRPPPQNAADEQLRAAREHWEQSRLASAHNSWLVGMNRRRLDGEAIRDALLAAAAQLHRELHGPGVRPPLPPELVNTLLKNQWDVSAAPSDHHRRSAYLFVRRNLRYPLLDVFDRPDTNATCPQRSRSVTAPQALTLLNGELSTAAARDLAAEITLTLPTKNDSLSSQVDLAYRRTLARPPTPAESALAQIFLATEPFADLCLALLNLNEFIYID